MTKSIEFTQTLPSAAVLLKTRKASIKATVIAMMNNAFVILKRRHELARQRRHLANLDAAQLRDIGVTRQAALSEAARPLSDDSWVRQKHNKSHNNFWL